ncbi:TetR/AcrR family transcriptional regulator [Thermopolyspora sp. NPDC052614]|uniref:TetR/AcrR family transcriptional regulator n=1 Tax=Thermopolyspora sp. NPDC052614 TaxID=3155682 RepID=UPI00342A3166
MTTQREAVAARAPGRPRSEKAEKAIIAAVIDLLAEGLSLSELSIEAIAQRAGVGKTTIYRRWSSKEDLVLDALTTLKAPVPDFGDRSTRDALVGYLRLMQNESEHPRARCIMNVALRERERYPDLAERFHKLAIEPRRAVLRDMLQRGVDSGELRPDLDIKVAMSAIIGAMLYFTKWNHGNEPPADLPERIVEALFRGFAGGKAGGKAGG